MMVHKNPIEEELFNKIEGLKSSGDKTFRKILHLMNEGLPVEELLEQTYNLLHQIVQFDRLGIALLEDGESALRLFWVRSDLMTEKLSKGFKTDRISNGLRNILNTGKPRIIKDLSEYFDTHPESQTTPLILWDGIRSNLTCPLRVEGTNVGLIFFSSKVPNSYTKTEMDLYLEISDCISLIIKDYVRSHLKEKKHES